MIRTGESPRFCETAEICDRVVIIDERIEAESLVERIIRADQERIVPAGASEFDPFRLQIEHVERRAGRSVEIVEDPLRFDNRFKAIVA